MNWSDFLGTVYFRLFVRLERHRKTLALVDQFLALYGVPPGDPVRRQVLLTLEQTVEAVEAVRRAYNDLPRAYRPGISPFTTSGLAAHWREDFKIRNIRETQQERPPLPPSA